MREHMAQYSWWCRQLLVKQTKSGRFWEKQNQTNILLWFLVKQRRIGGWSERNVKRLLFCKDVRLLPWDKIPNVRIPAIESEYRTFALRYYNSLLWAFLLAAGCMDSIFIGSRLKKPHEENQGSVWRDREGCCLEWSRDGSSWACLQYSFCVSGNWIRDGRLLHLGVSIWYFWIAHEGFPVTREWMVAGNDRFDSRYQKSSGSGNIPENIPVTRENWWWEYSLPAPI